MFFCLYVEKNMFLYREKVLLSQFLCYLCRVICQSVKDEEIYTRSEGQVGGADGR